MEEFELKLKISPSDVQLRKRIGPDVFENIQRDILKRDRCSCHGCGWHPLDESKAMTALMLHVVEVNEEKPEESVFNILCKACHTTQHIDIALEKGWVQLVNSTHSQKSLIEICRIGNIYNSIKEDNTRYLKTPPSEFIEKMKAGKIPTNNKTKVLFTNIFEWGDL